MFSLDLRPVRIDDFCAMTDKGKLFIIPAALICLVLLSACSGEPQPASEAAAHQVAGRKNLNVLLITIDTLRADYLSCYGRKSISTPNIDALAARGVRCTQA